MYQGVLTATRGMGNDLIGSSSSMPEWSKIGYDERSYKRELSYISGNNRIVNIRLSATSKKNNQKELIKIWELSFFVTVFEENCDSNGFEIKKYFFIWMNKKLFDGQHNFTVTQSVIYLRNG